MDVEKILAPFELFSKFYKETEQMKTAIEAAGGTQEDVQRLLGPLRNLQGLLINIAVFLESAKKTKKNCKTL